MKYLITGATGFVGANLLTRLDQPVVLSRNAERARQRLDSMGIKAADVTVFEWNSLQEFAPAEAFEGVEAVIHLAGESVGEGRWTKAKKVRIRESRVVGTRNLVETLLQLPQKPKVLISASAVGFYGEQGDQWIDEQTPPKDDFLAEVCAVWEAESKTATEAGIRVVHPRIGVVLGPGGGALQKMLLPFKLGLGSPLGSGKQWMPWIHIDDLVELFLYIAANESISGPINAVSPQAADNRRFTKALGNALHRPIFFPPVPGFMLRLLMGEFAEVLLCSQRVRPQAAMEAGFAWKHEDLDEALKAILE